MNKVIIENGIKILCIDDKKYKISEIPAVIEKMERFENKLNEKNEYLETLSDEVEIAQAGIELMLLDDERSIFVENLKHFVKVLTLLDVDDDNHTFGVAFRLFFELKFEEGYEFLKHIEIPAVRNEKISKALAQQFMLKLNFYLFFNNGQNLSGEEYDNIASNTIKYYKEVFKINKDDFETSDILSTLYFRKENFEEAKIYCKRMVELMPNESDLLNNLGDCYFKTQNSKKAIECFEKSIKLDPDFAETWTKLGDAYFREANIDSAIECFLEALKLEPENAKINANLGFIYHHDKDFDEAIYYYEKAVSLKPLQIDDYKNLGVCYREAGFPFKAIALYKQILILFPKDYDMLLAIGDIYSCERKYSKAIEFYHKALALKPFDKDIFWELSFAYSVKKNKKETLYYLEQHIIHSPNFGDENRVFIGGSQEFLWLENDPDFRKLLE